MPSNTPTITPSPSITPSPTCTNTPTSTPTSTYTPTPTATPDTIQVAISYMQQYSPGGRQAYAAIMANGVSINYNSVCSGSSQGKNIWVPKGSCPNGTPTYVAGTIAHEQTHLQFNGYGTLTGHKGSLLEEYTGFLRGDIVRADIINAGKGATSDMKHSLSVYTVNLDNPDRNQLASELNAWFNQYEKLYITDKSQGGYGVLQPFPSIP